jgi:hypothetical protein
MKKIGLILAITVSFLGVGKAVYASPLNEKATELIDYCLSLMQKSEDPCKVEKTDEIMPEMKKQMNLESSVTPHCMTEGNEIVD